MDFEAGVCEEDRRASPVSVQNLQSTVKSWSWRCTIIRNDMYDGEVYDAMTKHDYEHEESEEYLSGGVDSIAATTLTS